MVNDFELFKKQTLKFALDNTLEGAEDVDLSKYECSDELEYPMQGGNIQLNQVIMSGKDRGGLAFTIVARYYKMAGIYYLMVSADIVYPEAIFKNRNFVY